jgi:hypothetical protein
MREEAKERGRLNAPVHLNEAEIKQRVELCDARAKKAMSERIQAKRESRAVQRARIKATAPRAAEGRKKAAQRIKLKTG